MNHWEILIIPLIAIGAWILSTIFKENEGDKSKGPQRRLNGGARTRVPRRPSPVLDSFLNEARQRNETPEQTESSRPAPRLPVPVPSRPVTPRSPVRVMATVIEEPPVLLPLSKPAPPPVPRPSAPPPSAPKYVRPTSPVLKEVLRLLRSPKTAGVAFVMREILDRPVALRRR